MLAKENRIAVRDPFARQLMDRYIGKRRADISALRVMENQDDFASIERKGHNLFGSGSAYGIDAISTLGSALEKAAAQKDRKEICRLIDKLESFITHVIIT
ncbi:MAG: hypothetical protein AAGF72_11220 [Pseudomonadota bacterium]